MLAGKSDSLCGESNQSEFDCTCCMDFLDLTNGGVMSTELRNAIKVAALYPPMQHEEKACNQQKLREPKQLYSATSLQHPPKWPIECQVVPEKVEQLNIPPTIPEPFYVTTNSEPQPRPVGEEMGTVIYDYQPKLCVDYYCRSSFVGAEELTAYDFDETTLKFESRFEGGNLAKVIKVTNVFYELYLRPDMYTDRHAQWYYFRIRNMKENIVYRFSIVNLSKADSLYRYGMKPLLYSEKNAQMNGVGWMRTGHNISYYKNDIMMTENSVTYTLTFNLKFQHSDDTVYIAQCYPYTYSNLQLYLQEIQSDPHRARLCQQRLLCKSLAGNNVYVLTITAPESQEEEEQVKKPAIVLTARVHPGESPSSFMMKGVIDFLTSESPHAEVLRNRFIFKIIPMLNPDGVVVGNSRCCLLGQDLNRQYRTVLREAFPQIYQKKVLLRRLVDENGIFLYCDIHGHSRKNNVFMYGCENRRLSEKKLTEQVFPLMMHKNAADKFSFSNCKFRIQKSKEGTGRIFVWTLGVTNSYTLEISLCGSTLVSRENTHFNFVDYEDLGRHFCETLLDYSDTTASKEKIRLKILEKLKTEGSTAEEPKNIPISDYSSLSHSDSDNESDTTEDDDELDTAKSKASIARQASLRTMRNKKPSKPKSEEGMARYVKAESTEGKRYVQRRRAIGRLDSAHKSKRSAISRSKNFPSESATIAVDDISSERQMNPTACVVKCTSVRIDDPFRPPGISVITAPESQEETVDTGTQTEDECDFSDATFRNDIYLTTPRARTKSLVTSFESLNLLPRFRRSQSKSDVPRAQTRTKIFQKSKTRTESNSSKSDFTKSVFIHSKSTAELSLQTKSKKQSSRIQHSRSHDGTEPNKLCSTTIPENNLFANAYPRYVGSSKISATFLRQSYSQPQVPELLQTYRRVSWGCTLSIPNEARRHSSHSISNETVFPKPKSLGVSPQCKRGLPPATVPRSSNGKVANSKSRQNRC